MAKKKKLLNAYQISRDDNWRSRTGHLPIKLTNDYLFRALIQSDPDTRNSIIASLLGISVDEILETTVENPILLGESLEDKYFFLDIRVIFNRSAVINLELQVSNEHNWPERSLGYLCRCFDNLNHGISYRDTKAAYQFGFLDFTLFKDEPKFFSRYKLQDTKTHRVYTDKFQLGVVDLTKIGLATEEDKKYKLDMWARMFKAKTWEELRMLATKDKAIERAITSVVQLTEDEMIKEQCRQREEFYGWRKAEIEEKLQYRETIAKQKAQIADLESMNANLQNQICVLHSQNANLQSQNYDLKSEFDALKNDLKMLKEKFGLTN